MMKKLVCFIAIMAMYLWAPFQVAAQTQIQFDPYLIVSTNESFWVINNSNANGDNLSDLYLGSTNGPIGNNFQIKSFIQSPDPDIGLYPGYSFNYPASSGGIVSMEIKDLNNDNLEDLVIGYADAIQIYFNNAGIQLLDTTINLGATVCDVAIGDINVNGRVDIVVGTYSGLKIVMQNSNGSFTAFDYQYNNYGLGLSGLCSIEMADVEGNGDLDIIWLSRSYITGPRVADIIIRQNGSLMQPYHLWYMAPPNYLPTTLIAAELDDDPGIDIAISLCSSDTAATGEIVIWSSANMWTNPYASDTIYTNHGSQALKAKDMNKDGLTDLVQIYNANETSVLTQNSESDFSEVCFHLPTNISGYNPESIIVGDYNNDTLDDIAIADMQHGLVVLYQDNTTTGLETITSVPILKIFPNPVSGYFEVNSTSSGQLEIIDFLGRTISAQQINRDNNRVDCSNLASGTYLIKLIDQTGIKQAKIIKQ